MIRAVNVASEEFDDQKPSLNMAIDYVNTAFDLVWGDDERWIDEPAQCGYVGGINFVEQDYSIARAFSHAIYLSGFGQLIPPTIRDKTKIEVEMLHGKAL